MATTCIRCVNRCSLSSLRSYITKAKGAAAPPPSSSRGSAAPCRRFQSLSRFPVELACCAGSLFPLHSAVAAARMTSRLSLTSRALSQGTLCRTSPGL